MDNRQETISVYERLLNGKAKALSQFFFQPSHVAERIQILIKYVIEEKMKITPEEAVDKLTLDVLNEYKLKSILKYIKKPDEYDEDNLAYVVYYAYPNLPQPSNEELAIRTYKEVLDGKRKNFPKNYFIDGNYGELRAICCFKYLCEDLLKFDSNEIYETFSNSKCFELLSKYKLKIIMNVVFSSTTDLLETVYPDILKTNSKGVK